jgi:hypothetical protein
MVEYEIYFGDEVLKFNESRRQEAFDFYDRLIEENKVTCFLYQITHKELDFHYVEPSK